MAADLLQLYTYHQFFPLLVIVCVSVRVCVCMCACVCLKEQYIWWIYLDINDISMFNDAGFSKHSQYDDVSFQTVLMERNSLSVDDNICSPMGVELSGEGIASRRYRNAKLFQWIEHSGIR